MKWAKYSGLLLLLFCLFFGLSPLKQVKASQYKPLSEYNNIYITAFSNRYRLYWSDNSPNISFDGTYYLISNSNVGTIGVAYSSLDEVLSELDYYYNLRMTDEYNQSQDIIDYIYIYKGNYNGVAPPGSIVPDPPEPSWWDKVKQAFMDFVGSEALSNVLSGDWLSYIDDVLFGELWTVKVGEGEDDMIIPATVSATPTPSPTPIPTPIPYSTVIDPGTGEIHYHYTIDVSGTPVPTSSIYPPVTSAPPGPGSGSTVDEPVAVEDYYEPEDSLSVPKLRIFKFLLRMTGNDVDVGMDSLDDNMAVMDATLEDNAEAISGVGDLFQLIPVKWFILIGTLACFPVIAAMIKSLLGG